MARANFVKKARKDVKGTTSEGRMINDLKKLGESDLAFILFIMSSNATSIDYTYHVHVVKNRMGGPSKHEFGSLKDALDFIDDLNRKWDKV